MKEVSWLVRIVVKTESPDFVEPTNDDIEGTVITVVTGLIAETGVEDAGVSVHAERLDR